MTISRAQMNRQLYQMGGPIDEARSFYRNNLGLGEEETETVLNRAMASLNERTQPQSMMQMASNGGRIGLQMGGISTLPMDTGMPLQVPQQTSFSMPMQPMSSPMANYGQTPLMMQGGGIARLGYQTGGVTLPSQGPEMAQAQSMDPQQAQQALNTIIQILIENGLTPEQAKELALQILQIFAAGGEPAVEAFANELEQQDEMQMMAGGGIAGLYPRQGYGFGKIVKGITGAVKSVANAVKSVAKSDIGRIALTVAAGYFLGPAGGLFSGAGLGAGLATQMGVSAAFAPFVAGAINAAAGNILTNFITGGKITAKGILTAGTLGGIGGTFSPTTVGIDPATGRAITTATTTAQNLAEAQANVGLGNPNMPTYESDISSMIGKGENAAFTLDKATLDPAAGANAKIYNPGIVENKSTMFQDFKTSLSNPIKTLQDLGSQAVGLVQEFPKTSIATALGIGTGIGVAAAPEFRPQRADESDSDYQAEKRTFITDYGKNVGITNRDFYTREGAAYPFAADGGRIGYAEAGIVDKDKEGIMQIASDPNPLADRDDLARDLFGKPYFKLTPEQQEQLDEYIREKSKKESKDTMFAARGGSMVPPARQIEGGIIELDARKSGGYIPYGKKERVDDVPAMLAKDEFVFTSRAVKAAGDGSARRGAAKMYKIMKQLEAKGMKMERGARA